MADHSKVIRRFVLKSSPASLPGTNSWQAWRPGGVVEWRECSDVGYDDLPASPAKNWNIQLVSA